MSICHDKPILKSRGRNRKGRVKTFKSEDLANAWAKNNKITNYKLVDLKPAAKVNKIRIEFVE